MPDVAPVARSAPTAPDTPLLEARGVSVSFGGHRTLLSRIRREPAGALRAVDGVDLQVRRGETLALVGESGSGKSTLARALVGLNPVDTGDVLLDGRLLPARRSRTDFRAMQMVFQDPYSSLNPRLTVGRMLRELQGVHGIGPAAGREAAARELLATVGLGPSAWDAYPRQFSGGQRQRVAIARALVLQPELLVADEPVSALDVSVQATILNLLSDLTESLGLAMLFVAHNLAVVRHLCDRVAVMYLGRIVEVAPTEQLFHDPQHPYTQGLLRAIPRLLPGAGPSRAAVPGDPPSPYAIPTGCRFHPRCPIATDRCRVEDPALAGPGAGPGDVGDPGAHVAACHYAFDAHPTVSHLLPNPTTKGLRS